MDNDAMDKRALDEFLNDLASGRVPGERGDLDRSLIEPMLRLWSLAQMSLPESSRGRVDQQMESVIDRLARDERKEAPMDQSSLATVLPRRIAPNGYDAAFGTRAGPPLAPGAERRVSRALAWFATAALLAMTIGLGYVAFGPFRSEPEPPPAIPAVLAQPATPEDANEIRFDLTLAEPVLPAGPIYSWSTMYSVEPGLNQEYPGFAIESPVAALVWVHSGALAITGHHGAVHRESTALPDASPAADELLLGPGDAVALELGPNRSYQLRSAGSEPLVFAEFWLIAGPRPLDIAPPGYEVLDYYNDPSAVILTTAATATMHLTRATLAPDETLTAPEDGWQMVLTNDAISVIRTWPGGTTRSTRDDPITVVAMTADFQPVAGTPTAATPTSAAPEATPAALVD